MAVEQLEYHKDQSLINIGHVLTCYVTCNGSSSLLKSWRQSCGQYRVKHVQVNVLTPSESSVILINPALNV